VAHHEHDPFGSQIVNSYATDNGAAVFRSLGAVKKLNYTPFVVHSGGKDGLNTRDLLPIPPLRIVDVVIVAAAPGTSMKSSVYGHTA